MRLFVAIQLPNAAAERASTLLPERIPALRRVPAPLLHVTLAFLGSTPPERLRDVTVATSSACGDTAPFDIVLRGLGRFPTSGAPSVIWLGVSDGLAPLAALADRVRAALAAHGIAHDEKPFRPHVTLARVRPGVPPAEGRAIADALAAARPAEIAFRADAVRVVESVLSPKGARHTPVAEVPLAGGAPA